jgi:DNA-binding CsgD family transcriptional regulator
MHTHLLFDPGPDEIQAFAHVLQEIGQGVLLVDGRGALRFANRQGQAELNSGTTLVDDNGHLTTVHTAQREQLARALSDAFMGQRSLMEFGIAPHARMHAVVPLPSGHHVLVLCGKRDPVESLTLTLFAKAIGLTSAERVVLADLCHGHAAQDIASRQAVCLSTVRTHIGRIREKTGTRTMLQVLRKVTTLPSIMQRAQFVEVVDEAPRACL